MKHLRTPNLIHMKSGHTRQAYATETWLKNRELHTKVSEESAEIKESVSTDKKTKELSLREISDILAAQPFVSVREMI